MTERKTYPEPRSLVELVRRRAAEVTAHTAYTFLLDGEAEEIRLSYGELDERARAIGGWLQQRRAAGERVLLLYPPGLDFIAAFFGCLYAGAIAVPAYPPRLNRSLQRLESIVRDATPAFALTTHAILEMAGPRFAEDGAFRDVTLFATDGIERAAAGDWREEEIAGDHLAFLQYTSGSTSTPKGVMVSHDNLIHNERVIRAAMEHDQESTFVGWLPVYHDMGLIGNVLQPLFLGSRCILMSPAAFLQRPLRWLQAISRYRGRTAGAPNFAYELCVRKTSAEDRAGLDLSSWRVAYNGAEPIHHATLERFAETFEPYGFRREALYPCYGLAEATLLVTGVRRGTSRLVSAVSASALERHAVAFPANADDEAPLVSCGGAWLDQRVLVVDPETRRPSASDRVGEIWVSGPSVARGYWARPDESAATFAARLADTDEGPFLRTGDLGFLQDGELFVTGRLKDLIIIRGLNHYPQDIERTAEASHRALRPGCSAAFAITRDGEERLVLVHEVEREQRGVGIGEVAAAIRQAVSERHEIQVHAVVLVKPGSILKTSSGKIQRRACRAAFLEGTLEVVASHVQDGVPARPDGANEALGRLLEAPAADRRRLVVPYLLSEAARVLRTTDAALDRTLPLTALGLDSLMAIELKSRIEGDLGIALPIDVLLSDDALDVVAARIVDQWQRVSEPADVPAARHGEARVASPEQERLWQLDRLRPGDPALHVPAAVQIDGPLEVHVLEDALRALAERHEPLRTGFVPADRPGAVSLLVSPVADLPLEVADVGDEAELESRIAECVARPFDVARAPLARVSLFRRAAGRHVLLLTLHHLAGDLWSTQVFFEDLFELYAAAVAGRTPALLPLPLPYSAYAGWSRAQADTDDAGVHRSYWGERLAGATPTRWPDGARRHGHGSRPAGAHFFSLDSTLVTALESVARAQNATLFVVLLAAFERLLQSVTQADDLLITSPVSGRPGLDWERHVGFFARPIPLRTDLSGDPTVGDLIRRLRETVREAAAHQDLPFARMSEAAGAPLSVMFGFLSRRSEPAPPGLAVRRFAVAKAATDFDLFLTWVRAGDGLEGMLEYDAQLFDARAAAWIGAAYETLLRQIAGVERRLSAWEVPAAPAAPGIAVAATFTADPIAPLLEFWLAELGREPRVRLAPYGQVFQPLLDPESVFSRNRGLDVVLVRMEDWLRSEAVDHLGPTSFDLSRLERSVHDLAEALAASAARTATPHLVIVCPLSPAVAADNVLAEALVAAERDLEARLRGTTGLEIVSAAELAGQYALEEVHDAYGERHGHVPFRPAYFAALATRIARAFVAHHTPPRKVLVLDCDQTLWKGVCAEDGPRGVEIDDERLALQRWALGQRDAGLLLCLCSKNREEDVLEVFAQRSDMPLRLEHFVARRINWRSKAENLQSLAEELGLDPSSFVLIDDSPVECAEVGARRPDVLTIELPADPRQLAPLLRHLWPLDARGITAEDRQRSDLYRQDQERQRARRGAPSLRAFLDGLELEVAIADLADEDRARASQLTHRTNQFNVTTRRRSEAELGAFVAAGGEARVVRVRDRFGDYGLVGLVLFTNDDVALEVDTLLLSCRVLGRGVEHRVLAALGRRAQDRGGLAVRIPFVPTARNQPAFEFLDGLPGGRLQPRGPGFVLELDAASAAGMRHVPSEEVVGATAAPPASAAARAWSLDSALVRRIATQWSSPERVLDAARARAGAAATGAPAGRELVEAGTETEARLVEIWRELLGVERIGVHDDFFQLGGHSLLGVQVLSRVRDAFGVELPPNVLFQALTVADLAREIEARPAAGTEDGLAAVLDQLTQMSDEEVAELLEKRRAAEA